MDNTKYAGSKVDVGNRNRRELLEAGACAGLAFAVGSVGLSCCPGDSGRREAELAGHNFAMVAYCCLECDTCDAYIATQKDDDRLRAKVAKEWRMKPEEISCDGCKSDSALFNCEAKKCAIASEVPTCAHCADFPSCDKEIWTKWPKLKERVEAMRTKLRS